MKRALFKVTRPHDDHETLFLERYGRLFEWARRLTNRGDEAEDLLHEAYVQFVATRPDLSEIRSLDAYLYGILHHLHVSSVRRVLRSRWAPLSMIDYDSAALALRNVNIRTELQARQELALVCEYACARKGTAKTGGVLILRYFHGYHPAEIARIVRSPARAVDDWLHLARHEARAYLSEPMGRRTAAHRDWPSPNGDYLEGLTQRIFDAREGQCAPDELDRFYHAPDHTHAGMKAPVLAHVVSCRRCLDHVNRILGLSSTDRYPTDSLGPGARSGERGGDDVARFARRAGRGLGDLRAHRPRELRIVANGFSVGSSTVTGRRNQQTLTVTFTERLEFVEVFSEQDVRLILLPIDEPPHGSITQSASVELDERRAVDVAVDQSGARPVVSAVYCNWRGAAEATPAIEPARARVVDDDSVSSATDRAGHAMDRWRSALGWLRGPRMAFLTIAVAVAVGAAVWIAYERTRGITVSDRALFAEVKRREAVLTPSDPALVVAWTHAIEELRASDGAVLTSSRVETWRDGRQLSARRVFGPDGRLRAGEWIDATGAVTLFRRDTEPRVQRAAGRPAVPTAVDDLWRYGPTGGDLEAILSTFDRSTLTETGDAYRVTYQRAARRDGGWLHGVVVTVSRHDRRITELEWRVSTSQGPRNYRVSRIGVRTVRRELAPRRILEVDPDLVSDRSSSRDRTGLVARLAPAMSLGLEVQVFQRLHELGACLGEEITVARTPAGGVVVDGIVDGSSRKHDVQTALASLAIVGPVDVRVKTTAEAATIRTRQRRGSIATRRVDVTNEIAAAGDRLRQYFLDRLAARASTPSDAQAASVDAMVQALAGRLILESRQALLHAWALKNLSDRFEPGSLDTAALDARRTWLAMIHDHARGYRREAQALRDDLSPIFKPADWTPGASSAAPEGWAPAIDLLIGIATDVDTAIRMAFTASTDHTSDMRVTSSAFWEALASAALLAAHLEDTP